jgi:hypothetical protein
VRPWEPALEELAKAVETVSKQSSAEAEEDQEPSLYGFQARHHAIKADKAPAGGRQLSIAFRDSEASHDSVRHAREPSNDCRIRGSASLSCERLLMRSSKSPFPQ